MPLKNYTTEVPANRSIQQIQDLLASRGATGILLEYEKNGTGRLEALCFKINLRGRDVAFRLPLQWRRAQEVMKRQRVRGAGSDDTAYRVAWRILWDWVDAQMAFLELETVELTQIFLPYAVTKDGRTFYEKAVEESGLLLGPGER